MDAQRAALVGERDDARAQVAALAADLQGVVAASESSNADDEHDPEGATIGFERAQLSSLLQAAQRRVEEADQALDRLADGGYGRCTDCGSPIGAPRLAARPSARTCIDCASARPGR